MKKGIRKIVAMILALCFMMLTAAPALAATAPEADIMPLYNNVSLVNAYVTVSDSGLMKIIYDVSGLEGITNKIVITTYIEKKTLFFFWNRVDIGETNDEWVDTIYDTNYYSTRQFQLASTGTYRVTVTYEIYGSGGSADEIPYVITKTY